MSIYYPPGYHYYYNSNTSNSNTNNYNNNNFYETRFVICFVCGRQAHVKPTKTHRLMLRCETHRLMLRCDLCRALMFANADTSQQYLMNLSEYREYY